MKLNMGLAFISLLIAMVAADEECPPGWVNSVEGCFLFEYTVAVTWRDAQEECERLGGFLAEVKTEEQAMLLTSLAVVQESILGITAWWIGLTDQGHEGRWIWQHSVEDTNYTKWATNYPDYTNSNADCAVMISRDSFMWSNTDCGGLAASPVCQREAGWSDGTTTVDTATTTVGTETTTNVYKSTTTTLYSDHVELRDGDSIREGNVFAVNNLGYLGPICDDNWSEDEATVVCRQLGFSSGTATTSSFFGAVPSKYAMDDVFCDGDEDTIRQCQSTVADNCEINEGAGVICMDGTTIEETTDTTTRYEVHVELRGGQDNCSGNVFAVNSNLFFGPICDDFWDEVTAAVVCRQLGFSTGVARLDSYYGEVLEEFAMNRVMCAGDEDTIQECSYENGPATCFGYKEGAAGVECS